MIDRIVARDVLATACFAAFVAGAYWSAPRVGQDSPKRKTRAVVFTLWTVGVSMGLGVTQRDLFPFTSWVMIAWIYPTPLPLHRFVAVDAAGAEHEVDYRAWQPMSVDELASWLAEDFVKLDSAKRAEVARDLLQRANDGAQRVMAGGRVGEFDKVFGPFTAPQFHLHPRSWQGPASVPPLPFRALRIYMEYWYPEEVARTPRHIPRKLLYQYPPSP